VNISLHANATTIPKTRRYIQASNQSVTQLAEELDVSEDTIRRWRQRDGVADGSHTPLRFLCLSTSNPQPLRLSV